MALVYGVGGFSLLSSVRFFAHYIHSLYSAVPQGDQHRSRRPLQHISGAHLTGHHCLIASHVTLYSLTLDDACTATKHMWDFVACDNLVI